MTQIITASGAAVEYTTSSPRDYLTLLKPGVMSLVVFTGAVGLFTAPGTLHPLQQFITLLCIAIGSGAGGAINMWYDRDIDASMHRTNKRPIPAGKIAPDDALVFGIALAVGSVMLLGLAVNWLSAVFLASGIAFYVYVYTIWLKRRTSQNIVIGGAAGAIPPVIGWAAVTGDTSLTPWLLFAITFFWTPPHFWALALYRHEDYARVGVPMLPVIAGTQSTKRQIIAYTVLLAIITLLPVFLGISGAPYLVAALTLNGIFLYHAMRVLHSDTPAHAIQMFLFSISYLFLLYTAFALDHWLGL